MRFQFHHLAPGAGALAEMDSAYLLIQHPREERKEKLVVL